ncbi:FYVE-domain-containing protein [Hypoxylon sp. FL1150]|nr:FYVE-domain-containing protein [Hypoxylon sp. FL1150]
MSGRDDEAAVLSPSGNGGHVVSDTESGSSYAGSAAPDTPACPYQNSVFFGNECSRYHDCPTHMAERSITEVGASASAPALTRYESIHRVTTTEHNNTVNGTDPVDSSAETYISTQEQVPASGSQLQQAETDRSALVEAGPPGPVAPQAGSNDQQELGITLAEALHQTPETLGGLSGDNEISSRSGFDTRSTPPIIRNGFTNATNLPVDQRPGLSLNPIAPGFTPRPGTGSAREFTVPRWQPDSEVTYCPICHTQFSFFIRKHHCRKCGRVVCNSCSPHRITIPHQYIVRHPGEHLSLQRYSLSRDEGRIADFSALGGGEQVRLCNPCVPDPNITPPQTQHSTNPLSPRSTHQRSHSSSSGNYYGDNNLSRYPPYLAAPSVPHDAYIRNRSLTMTLGPTPPLGLSNAYPSMQNRIMSGTPPSYFPPGYSQPYGYRSVGRSGSPNALNRRSRPALFTHYRESNPPYGSSSSSSSSTNRPLPRPPLAEEDECPVCHRELPSRQLANFESQREAHISSCIISYSAYGPGQDASGRSRNREPRRSDLMFPYSATEKDCVDSAECTICLEEFVVGVPMARLECLCRFHKSCIEQWFHRHRGRCPVHHALQY